MSDKNIDKNFHEIKGEIERCNSSDDLKDIREGLMDSSLLDPWEVQQLSQLINSRIDEIGVSKKEDEEECGDYDLDIDLDLPDVISSLKDSDQTYGQFLADRYFPLFHPMSDSSLYKIIAAISLFNSAAIPKPKVSIPLPITYIYGRSGSGKSYLATSFQLHYQQNETSIVTPNASPTILREEPHYISVRSEDPLKLRPALLILDNFYASTPKNIGGHFFSLLAWERHNAEAKVNKEGVVVTRCTWCSKVITSTDSIREIGDVVTEMERRTLPIPTTPMEPKESPYSYDRSSMFYEYRSLWSQKNIPLFKKSFKEIFSEFSFLSEELGEKALPSIVPIAIMLFSGIEDNLKSSTNTMKRYWEYVNAQEKMAASRIERILSEYLQQVPFKRKELAHKLGFDESFWRDLPAKDVWEEIFKADDSIRKNDRNWRELSSIMERYGYHLVFDGKLLYRYSGS